jgi:hypothetical protein
VMSKLLVDEISDADNTGPVTVTDGLTVQGAFTSLGIDDNATSTAMTIDSSENVLVGKTSADFGVTVGAELNANDTAYFTRSGGGTLTLNRLSSDGDIALFRKDGTTVGSIGTESGSGFDAMYVANGDTGLIFQGYANDAIIPFTAASLDKRDAAIDLGYSGGRFKDLYLSGGVYLGGTGAANKLDDYEEGAWAAVINTSTPPTTPFGQYNDGASYTKIGNVVFLYAMFRTNGVTIAGAAGDVIIAGLPFIPSSTVSGGGLTVLQTGSWVTGPRAGYARTTNDIILTYTPTATDEVSPLPYTALTTGAGLNNLIHIMGVYRTDS